MGAGKWGPEVVRVKRMVRHWRREVGHYGIEAAHWESLQGARGRHGAISLTRHALEKAGIDNDSWQVRRAGGQRIDVLAVVQGLDNGRDGDAMEATRKHIRSPMFDQPGLALKMALKAGFRTGLGVKGVVSIRVA